MKVYSNINEVTEVKKAQSELEKVLSAIEKVTELMERNSGFLINSTNRLQGELSQAVSNLNTVRGQLVAEEMRGGSTVETAKKVNAALSEVDRIKGTLEAFARTGGIALHVLEDKYSVMISNKQRLERDLEWQKSLGTFADPRGTLHPGCIPTDKKNQLIKETANKLDQINKEIAPIEQALNLLQANREKYGVLITADADTLEASNNVLAVAAKAWAVRDKARQELIAQLEATRQEIENLKESASILEDAIGNVDPDSIGEYVYHYDAAMGAMPELYSGDFSFQQETVKHRIKARIRELAAGI